MNEIFAEGLAHALDDTIKATSRKMIMEHLENKGVVTVEDAQFYRNLCEDVILESAEDFIPDEIEVPEEPEQEDPIELTDAVGNTYIFQNGALIPVEASEMSDDEANEMIDDMAEPEPDAEPDEVDPETDADAADEVDPETDAADEVDPETDADAADEVDPEVTDEDEDELYAESEETNGELLEESDRVVAKILASLNRK